MESLGSLWGIKRNNKQGQFQLVDTGIQVRKELEKGVGAIEVRVSKIGRLESFPSCCCSMVLLNLIPHKTSECRRWIKQLHLESCAALLLLLLLLSVTRLRHLAPLHPINDELQQNFWQVQYLLLTSTGECCYQFSWLPKAEEGELLR